MDLSEKLQMEKPTLLNFHATWCGPCHAMKPNLDVIVEMYGDQINYERVDIDQYPELAQKFHVRGVPTTIVVKSGDIKWREAGVYPASEIIKIIEANF